jgi:hypothetical protein
MCSYLRVSPLTYVVRPPGGEMPRTRSTPTQFRWRAVQELSHFGLSPHIMPRSRIEPLTFIAGRTGLKRHTAPPCVRAFAARTNPLAGPLAWKCGVAPEALANLRNIRGPLVAWRICRWGIGHDSSFARSHSRLRSSSVWAMSSLRRGSCASGVAANSCMSRYSCAFHLFHPP